MISGLKEGVLTELSNTGSCTRLPDDQYMHMKYPKLFTLMNFLVEQYEVRDYGHLMIMHTTTKMGMELLTMSFMPASCVNLPYLLIDAMTMKKKRCVFVEYYGCGNSGLEEEKMKAVFEKYKNLPDYEEKDNWYIKERTPYSLIKSGPEDELIRMATDSVAAYLSSVADGRIDLNYKEKLKAFRERMITEGNPSSKTLKMLLGKEGSEEFFRNVVMPV